jgi:hypothetical protein
MKQIISHNGDGVPLFINEKPKVEIPPGKMWNQCSGCGEIFESIYAFDYHREGEYGKNRRCLEIEEMLSKGMKKNRFQRWVSMTNEHRLSQ